MRNLLLISALIVASTSAIAQLHVSPNGGTDSYIYVNDEVLFVEQDVDLQANSAGATEASIYLRNDAQLLQGATASNNTGDGYLSVYQDSNSDSYDYNFWSSPVGNPTLSGSGNTNFGILSVYDPNTVTQSDLTATTTSVNGVGNPNLTISRRWLYKREAATGYQAIHLSNSVDPGLGFTMKGVGVSPAGGDPYVDAMNQTYDFRGRPNNGNISVGIAAGESTLSGNPYPSALDLNLVFSDPDNGEIQEFRFWDEDRSINSHNYVDNKGGYGTWIPGPSPYTTGGLYTVPTFLNYDGAGNPTGPTGMMGQATERLYSPIGQGFNIYANIAGDGQIVIKNSHRAFVKEGAGNNSEFRNPLTNNGGGDDKTGNGNQNRSNGDITADPSSGSPIVVNPYEGYPPMLRIHSLFEESHFRELLLVLWPESTDGYDRGLDAIHPMDGANAEAYFPIGSDNNYDPYVIQTLPYNIGKQVPINFETTELTQVKIYAAEEINLPSKAFIWDSHLNIFQEITNGGDANLTLEAGNHEGRYYVVFRGGDIATGTDTNGATLRREEVETNVDFFQNNRLSQLEIRNPEGYDIKAAMVFDMSGKVVISERELGNSSTFTFPTAALSDGVYLVKLATSDNIEIDYKITVHNKN